MVTILKQNLKLKYNFYIFISTVATVDCTTPQRSAPPKTSGSRTLGSETVHTYMFNCTSYIYTCVCIYMYVIKIS